MTTLLIQLPTEHYELFVAECDIKSREYSTLKNAVVHRDERNEEPPRVEIFCDIDEAKVLLEAAGRLYPEAVPFIEDALSVALEV